MARGKMNIEQFKAYLNLIPQSVRTAVNAEIHKQADGLSKTMKRVVERRTSQLAFSIEPEHQELRSFVRAGGDKTTRESGGFFSTGAYDYAMANEYGTENMEARPFFWGSYRLKKPQIKREISKAVREAIRKA